MDKPSPLKRGIIHGVHLDVLDDDFKSVPEVVKAERILRFNRDSKMKEPSSSVIVYFGGESIPSKVYLGYIAHSVKEYVPNPNAPNRCYNCQRYGHVASDCKSRLRCPSWGGNHEYKVRYQKCCLCGGEGCGKYKEAKDIQEFRVKNKVSYAEATKSIITQSSGKSQIVPAQIVRPKTAPVVDDLQIQSNSSSVEVISSLQPSLEHTQIVTENFLNQVVTFVFKVVSIAQDQAFWSKRDRKSRIGFITDIANKVFEVDLSSDSIHEMYRQAAMPQ